MKFRLFLVLVGVFFSVLSLADLSVNSLVPSGISWLSANSSYELATNSFEIRFTTPNSKLLQANLTAPGGRVVQVLNPSSCINNATFVTCSEDFDILTLNVTSSEVAATTDYSWNVLALDNDSGLVSQNLQFKVLNDPTAPSFTLNTPLNLTIVPNGTRTFTLTPTEEESGLASVYLFYDYYSTIATSSTTNSISLGCDGSCSNSTMLNAPPSQKYVGFFYNLSDRAGNVNTTPYFWLLVDDGVPEVNLLTPGNGLLTANASQQFFWSFDDNSLSSSSLGFTPGVNCSLLLDGVSFNTTRFNASEGSHQMHNFTGVLSSLAEGNHLWSLRCQDDASWTTTNGTRTFTLDRTGPVINLSRPANTTILANGTLINLSVTDSPAGVLSVFQSLNGGSNDSLGAPYALSTTDWPEGQSTLRISANDSLQNPSTTEYTFFVDVHAPGVELLVPASNEFGNGSFFFNTTDDWASSLNCSLLLNGTVQVSGSFNSGQKGVLSSSLPEGHSSWQARCTDGVGNVNTSGARTVFRDTVKPNILLISPLNSNGYNLSNTNTNGSSDFRYLLSDENPQSCALYVNSSWKATLDVPMNFTMVSLGFPASTLPASWYLVCNDTVGNTQTSASSYIYYDTLAPTLSALASSGITSGAATISWTTDEAANHTLYYHTNRTLLEDNLGGASKVVGSVGTTPSVSLSSLSSATVYYYVALSCDQFGQCSNSSGQLSSSNFTTSPAPVSPGTSSPSGGGGGGGTSGTSSLTEVEGTIDDVADCNDGEDNDGDGLTDLSDPGCESQNDGSEGNALVCAADWRCTEWSACAEGQQTRTCDDFNQCDSVVGKPEESQACGLGTAAGETAGEGTGPLGVGQAVGLFNRLKSSPGTIAGALGVLALLGLAGWQRNTVAAGFHKLRTYRAERLRKEEESIRKELRQQGVIK